MDRKHATDTKRGNNAVEILNAAFSGFGGHGTPGAGMVVPRYNHRSQPHRRRALRRMTHQQRQRHLKNTGGRP